MLLPWRDVFYEPRVGSLASPGCAPIPSSSTCDLSAHPSKQTDSRARRWRASRSRSTRRDQTTCVGWYATLSRRYSTRHPGPDAGRGAGARRAGNVAAHRPESAAALCTGRGKSGLPATRGRPRFTRCSAAYPRRHSGHTFLFLWERE